MVHWYCEVIQWVSAFLIKYIFFSFHSKHLICKDHWCGGWVFKMHCVKSLFPLKKGMFSTAAQLFLANIILKLKCRLFLGWCEEQVCLISVAQSTQLFRYLRVGFWGHLSYGICRVSVVFSLKVLVLLFCTNTLFRQELLRGDLVKKVFWFFFLICKNVLS